MTTDLVDLRALYLETLAQVERDAANIADAAFVLVIVRMSLAKSAIMQASRGSRPASGTTICPACNQVLRYSVSLKGRVWAHCETSTCVSFAE